MSKDSLYFRLWFIHFYFLYKTFSPYNHFFLLLHTLHCAALSPMALCTCIFIFLTLCLTCLPFTHLASCPTCCWLGLFSGVSSWQLGKMQDPSQLLSYLESWEDGWKHPVGQNPVEPLPLSWYNFRTCSDGAPGGICIFYILTHGTKRTRLNQTVLLQRDPGLGNIFSIHTTN